MIHGTLCTNAEASFEDGACNHLMCDDGAAFGGSSFSSVMRIHFVVSESTQDSEWQFEGFLNHQFGYVVAFDGVQYLDGSLDHGAGVVSVTVVPGTAGAHTMAVYSAQPCCSQPGCEEGWSFVVHGSTMESFQGLTSQNLRKAARGNTVFGSVQEIYLPQNGLRGSLTSAMFEGLAHLEMLDLQGNSLAGEIPRAVSELDALGHLHLHNNDFEGCLPYPLLALCESIGDECKVANQKGENLKECPDAQCYRDADTLPYEIARDYFSAAGGNGTASLGFMMFAYARESVARNMPTMVDRMLPANDDAVVVEVKSALGGTQGSTQLLEVPPKRAESIDILLRQTVVDFDHGSTDVVFQLRAADFSTRVNITGLHFFVDLFGGELWAPCDVYQYNSQAGTGVCSFERPAGSGGSDLSGDTVLGLEAYSDDGWVHVVSSEVEVTLRNRFGMMSTAFDSLSPYFAAVSEDDSSRSVSDPLYLILDPPARACYEGEMVPFNVYLSENMMFEHNVDPDQEFNVTYSITYDTTVLTFDSVTFPTTEFGNVAVVAPGLVRVYRDAWVMTPGLTAVMSLHFEVVANGDLTISAPVSVELAYSAPATVNGSLAVDGTLSAWSLETERAMLDNAAFHAASNDVMGAFAKMQVGTMFNTVPITGDAVRNSVSVLQVWGAQRSRVEEADAADVTCIWTGVSSDVVSTDGCALTFTGAETSGGIFDLRMQGLEVEIQGFDGVVGVAGLVGAAYFPTSHLELKVDGGHVLRAVRRFSTNGGFDCDVPTFESAKLRAHMEFSAGGDSTSGVLHMDVTPLVSFSVSQNASVTVSQNDAGLFFANGVVPGIATVNATAANARFSASVDIDVVDGDLVGFTSLEVLSIKKMAVALSNNAWSGSPQVEYTFNNVLHRDEDAFLTVIGVLETGRTIDLSTHPALKFTHVDDNVELEYLDGRPFLIARENSTNICADLLSVELEDTCAPARVVRARSHLAKGQGFVRIQKIEPPSSCRVVLEAERLVPAGHYLQDAPFNLPSAVRARVVAVFSDRIDSNYELNLETTLTVNASNPLYLNITADGYYDAVAYRDGRFGNFTVEATFPNIAPDVVCSASGQVVVVDRLVTETYSYDPTSDTLGEASSDFQAIGCSDQYERIAAKSFVHLTDGLVLDATKVTEFNGGDGDFIISEEAGAVIYTPTSDGDVSFFAFLFSDKEAAGNASVVGAAGIVSATINPLGFDVLAGYSGTTSYQMGVAVSLENGRNISDVLALNNTDGTQWIDSLVSVAAVFDFSTDLETSGTDSPAISTTESGSLVLHKTSLVPVTVSVEMVCDAGLGYVPGSSVTVFADRLPVVGDMKLGPVSGLADPNVNVGEFQAVSLPVYLNVGETALTSFVVTIASDAHDVLAVVEFVSGDWGPVVSTLRDGGVQLTGIVLDDVSYATLATGLVHVGDVVLEGIVEGSATVSGMVVSLTRADATVVDTPIDAARRSGTLDFRVHSQGTSASVEYGTMARSSPDGCGNIGCDEWNALPNWQCGTFGCPSAVLGDLNGDCAFNSIDLVYWLHFYDLQEEDGTFAAGAGCATTDEDTQLWMIQMDPDLNTVVDGSDLRYLYYALAGQFPFVASVDSHEAVYPGEHMMFAVSLVTHAFDFTSGLTVQSPDAGSVLTFDVSTTANTAAHYWENGGWILAEETAAGFGGAVSSKDDGRGVYNITILPEDTVAGFVLEENVCLAFGVEDFHGMTLAFYGMSPDDFQAFACFDLAPYDTASPTSAPTASPTFRPSAGPTAVPTLSPSASPSTTPTATPTAVPTAAPTSTPTAVPSAIPTALPSLFPTSTPTVAPTTVVPTTAPTAGQVATNVACLTDETGATSLRGPCKNDAACVEVDEQDFECECAAGWQNVEFDTCIEIYDPCEESPCKNEGTCVSASGEFTCYCVPGWTGDTCEDCGDSSIVTVLPANPFAYLTEEEADFLPKPVVLTLSNFIGSAATTVNWGGIVYTFDNTATPNTIELVPEYMDDIGQYDVVVSSDCANLTFTMTYIAAPKLVPTVSGLSPTVGFRELENTITLYVVDVPRLEQKLSDLSVSFNGEPGTVVSASDADGTVVVTSPTLEGDDSLGDLACALVDGDDVLEFVFRFLTIYKDPAISKVLPTCACGGVGDTLAVSVKDIGAETAGSDVSFFLENGGVLVELETVALETTRIDMVLPPFMSILPVLFSSSYPTLSPPVSIFKCLLPIFIFLPSFLPACLPAFRPFFRYFPSVRSFLSLLPFPQGRIYRAVRDVVRVDRPSA
jgi:hypothetical protein